MRLYGSLHWPSWLRYPGRAVLFLLAYYRLGGSPITGWPQDGLGEILRHHGNVAPESVQRVFLAQEADRML